MRVFKRCIGDFEENSTSLEGRLDSSKSPRSNPPLLEGPLEISNRPRSMGVQVHARGWYKVTLVKPYTVVRITPTQACNINTAKNQYRCVGVLPTGY